jgi:TatD DNase family protein
VHYFIDSHFHLLAMEAKGINVDELIQQMKQQGMLGIDIGLTYNDLGQRIERFGSYKNLRFAAGIGPWGVAEDALPITVQLDALHEQLTCYPGSAIGEIGLDNHWKYGNPAAQEELVHLQLDLAEEHSLPVIFHNREADEQFIRILASREIPNGGVFHCYQGGEALAQRAVDRGLLLSFAGPLTYRSNTAMQRLFALLPIDSILLETDSPFLAPVPLRGTVNTPLSMIHIYTYAAKLRGIDVDALAEQVRENYDALFTNRGVFADTGGV